MRSATYFQAVFCHLLSREQVIIAPCRWSFFGTSPGELHGMIIAGAFPLPWKTDGHLHIVQSVKIGEGGKDDEDADRTEIGPHSSNYGAKLLVNSRSDNSSVTT